MSYGPIVDTATEVNLTEKRLQEFSKFVFKDLPFKDAIKMVKGDGSRVIATFEDPNCGFCRKQMTEVEKLDNVTIYTFLIPILGPIWWLRPPRSGARRTSLLPGLVS